MRGVDPDIAEVALFKREGHNGVMEINAEAIDIEYGGRLRYSNENIMQGGRLTSDMVGGRLGSWASY